MAAPKKMLVVADVSNLYYCIAKKYGKARLDYQKYLDVAARYGDIYRAIAYGAQIGDQARGFIDYLRHRGFVTKYKEPRIYRVPDSEKEYRKADWDVGIAIDVVKILPLVDIIALGSADSDMIPLVEWVQSQGKQVVTIACNIAYDLKQASDEWYEIGTELLEIKDVDFRAITESMELPADSRSDGDEASAVRSDNAVGS